ESLDINYAGAVLAPEITAYVKLAPETLYSGQVVDTAGNPIPDVRVAAEYAEDPSQIAVTGADGIFQVASGSRPTLYFSHPDYGLTWIKAGEPEAVQTTLQPGASFRLRVTQGNNPLPGAMVQVVSDIPKALGYALQRETDETGCVLFDQVPADAEVLGDVAVFVTAPNGVKARLTEIPNLQPGKTTESVLTLPETYPGEVSGTVSDGEGNPVAGIPVIVAAPEDIPLFSWTDENGAYTAPLPFGLSQVFVARDLLAPGQVVAEPAGKRFEVNTPGTTFTQDFTITQVKKVVTFVGSDGAPIEELWLRMWPVLYVHTHSDSIRWRVATANGRIAVLNESARIYYAYDPLAEQLATFTQLTEDQTELTVTLDQPAGAIAGRIVDPNGKPLPAVSVNTTRPSPDYPYVYTWSDTEGRFRIEPLPMNASYGLNMSLQGYQLLPGSSVTGFQPAQEPTPLEFVMAPMDAGVLGQVVAADGSPLARVYMSLRDGARNVGGGRSGNDGAFYFEVAEGVYTMWIMAPDLSAMKTLTVYAPSTDTIVTLPVQPQPPVTDVPAPRSRESERAENNFKQMGLVFKMFANEAAGEMFPPLEARQGVFTPEWKKIYPEYLTDPSVLFPDNGVSHCYFAHALTSETQGLAFLDAVQQLGIEAVRDTDIQVGAGNGSAGGDTILRLSESLPQQLFPDQPAAQALAQANVPILWEVPGEREESGGWVLYMDGHVQWQPYPGPFPMTEQFVTRIRRIMGLPN
ncbi:MAG: carboxypeptidase regulatory-like domain-containing protein, partial [Candidatus Hydrogenedentota bacterium]